MSEDREAEGRAEPPSTEEVEALFRAHAVEILELCARYGLDEVQAVQAVRGAGLKLATTPSLPARRPALLLRAIENEAREIQAGADQPPEDVDELVH